MRCVSLLLALLSVGAPDLQAQERLMVVRQSGGPAQGIEVAAHRGFAAFEASALNGLGWVVEEDSEGVRATYLSGGPTVEAAFESPYLHWGTEGVHLAQTPYLESGRAFLPLQFLVDILPWKLPDTYGYDPATRILALQDGPQAVDSVRVVVIDAGHGGRDPGTVGRGGTMEKDVVLGVATELARILRAQEGLEVHLTRDSDVLPPIWQRGELATRWKGSRNGVFISIHANALPNDRVTRGFETYFLSEARTDHERRVAALENSALELEEEGNGRQGDNPDLGFILTELRNLDHAHWSSLLAEIVQEKLDPIHPGTNRGVKQAPLAVITNSLMPAVLVEVGFLSNPEEEALLNRQSFQSDLARSVASAVLEFFRRYPPGAEWGEGS